ncbi:MAG TPA: hypothetical protein VGG85_02870 [Terracidiphilus sp.]|jgi:hypothetical protein
MTPNLAIVRVESQYWRCPPLPLPVFLLWIPALVLAPIVLPILWVVCIFTHVRLWATLGVLWDILCGLPGTHVRVVTDGHKVTVRIL